MNTLSYKTASINKANANKQWLIVDAKDETLGRLASRIAYILRGKHKPEYTPHDDCGDYVIVLNADKITLTGLKMEQKEYISHSGFPGGQKSTTPAKLLAKKPTAVVEKAIKGMLPKNRLGRAIFKNCHVYAGTEHTHEAQKPKAININDYIN